jgi:PhzF family phenazine biosynthesis protein
MNIPIYQVDAFTNKVFSGNPAAVCPLRRWLDEEIMQNIATENNLSETAFFVKDDQSYYIRWFTPVAEVDLCGHATLASAYVIFTHLTPDIEEVVFHSKSGLLTVTRESELLKMDFPSLKPEPCTAPEKLISGLGREPLEVWFSDDYLALFKNEEEIRSISPDFQHLKEVGLRGIIITAPGNSVDFVSRFFAPSYGINEDPVTGSAHSILTPFWAEKLNKSKLHALQISRRGGELFCENSGNRVIIVGQAAEYMQGLIHLDI